MTYGPCPMGVGFSEIGPSLRPELPPQCYADCCERMMPCQREKDAKLLDNAVRRLFERDEDMAIAGLCIAANAGTVAKEDSEIIRAIRTEVEYLQNLAHCANVLRSHSKAKSKRGPDYDNAINFSGKPVMHLPVASLMCDP